MPDRRVHDVYPNRQRELAPKRAAINLLRFVEPRPNCAGKIGIVSGKKSIGEIVGGAGFARRRDLFQTKLRVCGFSRPRLQRIDQTGMHFVSGLRFDDCLPGATALGVPHQRSVLFFDPLQNVWCACPPAAVWKYCVSQRELGERDLAAAQKRGGIRAQRRTNAGGRTELQDRIDACVHTDTDGCAVL